MYNKRKIGDFYEDRAVKYLEERGYDILDRNFYSRYGELDVVARKGEYLVIVEIKYRAEGTMVSPGESVNYSKQRKICLTTKYYLYKRRISPSCGIRFDVILFEGQNLKHIENAFEFVD